MIKVYSSDNCTWCQKLKRYLKSKNIDFQEFNVESSENAQAVFKLTGQNAVPVTIIENKIIIGFDMNAIEDALKSSTSSTNS